MAKVITFGEIMLRLKSPSYERFFQSPVLEATFGGGEANVAVSLANYGMDASFVTVLPKNDIADACIRELRGFGVDTSKIVRKDGRLGIYYLETGAVQRPSKVVYDRAGSAIAEAKAGDIDWKSVFDGATWFHLTGITPAISQGAADLSLEAVKAAKEMGVHVSCDLNYRKNLWKYGKRADEVMTELVKYVDTVIANEEDFQKSLGLSAESASAVQEGQIDVELYKKIASSAMAKYPNIKRVAINAEACKTDRDDETLKKLNEEMRTAYSDIMSNENMKAYNDAKQAFDKVLQRVLAIVQQSADGQDPDTTDYSEDCTHDCSTCGGCG